MPLSCVNTLNFKIRPAAKPWILKDIHCMKIGYNFQIKKLHLISFEIEALHF